MAIWKAVVHQEVLGQQVLNIWHMGTESSGTAIQAQDTIENLIENGYEAALRPHLSNEWKFTGLVTLQDVSSPGLPPIPIQLDPFLGQNVLDPLPPQLACLITWRSDTAKPNRAFKYLSGWCTDLVTPDARVTGSIVSALDTFAQVVINSQPLGGYLPFLSVRYYSDRQEVHQANQLTRYVVHDIISDRSTRKIGRGS